MQIFSCFLSCWSCLCQLPAEEMQDRSEPKEEIAQNVVSRIDGLREKALLFVGTCPKSLTYHRQEIVNDIFERLESPAFLADPKEYMKNWTEERGSTTEFRDVEDVSKLFFDRIVSNDQVDGIGFPTSGLVLKALQFVAAEELPNDKMGHEMALLDEIFTRLQDPAFLANPEQYMADWENGIWDRKFDVIRDNAKFFFAQVACPWMKDLQEKAVLFVETNPDINVEDKPLVLADILKRLADSNFEANPEKYFDDWSEARGKTREFRIPEDISRTFFHQIIYSTLSTK